MGGSRKKPVRPEAKPMRPCRQGSGPYSAKKEHPCSDGSVLAALCALAMISGWALPGASRPPQSGSFLDLQPQRERRRHLHSGSAGEGVPLDMEDTFSQCRAGYATAFRAYRYDSPGDSRHPPGWVTVSAPAADRTAHSDPVLPRWTAGGRPLLSAGRTRRYLSITPYGASTRNTALTIRRAEPWTSIAFTYFRYKFCSLVGLTTTKRWLRKTQETFLQGTDGLEGLRRPVGCTGVAVHGGPRNVPIIPLPLTLCY